MLILKYKFILLPKSSLNYAYDFYKEVIYLQMTNIKEPAQEKDIRKIKYRIGLL